MLLELLNTMNFVSNVRTVEYNDGGQNFDFFSCAGIWADRDINLKSIRQNAWALSGS